MSTYKDLLVWQKNQESLKLLVKLISQMPSSIPAREISSQVFRSLASVGANLAEGYMAFEGKEYSRYIGIALRSAVESDHWFETIKNLFESLSDQVIEVSQLNEQVIKMLIKLKQTIEEKRKGV